MVQVWTAEKKIEFFFSAVFPKKAEKKIHFFSSPFFRVKNGGEKKLKKISAVFGKTMEKFFF